MLASFLSFSSSFSQCPNSLPVWYHWWPTQLERHRLPAGFQLHHQTDEKEGLKVIKYDDEEFMPRMVSCNQASATVVICYVMSIMLYVYATYRTSLRVQLLFNEKFLSVQQHCLLDIFKKKNSFSFYFCTISSNGKQPDTSYVTIFLNTVFFICF